MDDREIARLCAKPLGRVMDMSQHLSFEGLSPEHCGKWEHLESLCEKQLDALRHRLVLLKSFSRLWVFTAREQSTKPSSAVHESGYIEFSLRVKVFEWLDEILIGTPMNYLCTICDCVSKLSDQWRMFQYPHAVRTAILARLWRLRGNCKNFMNFLLHHTEYYV